MAPENLAKRWQRQLEVVLVQALRSRQPQLVSRHVVLVPRLVGALVLLSIVLWLAWRFLRKRRAELKAVSTLNELDRACNDRRLAFNSVFLWITASWLVVIWLVGLVWILSLFPATALAAESLWNAAAVARPDLVFGRIVGPPGKRVHQTVRQCVERLAVRAAGRRLTPSAARFDDRSSRRRVQGGRDLPGRGRRQLRCPRTIDRFGLTIGAAVAFAASLAAQGIIRDLTNGFLILAEDQYAIGDIIKVGTVAGLVENLTLRVTQLRDDTGRFITIPNSQISVVENLTRAWSRVDFTVQIAFGSDVDRAIEVISEAAQELYQIRAGIP